MVMVKILYIYFIIFILQCKMWKVIKKFKWNFVVAKKIKKYWNQFGQKSLKN